jgi:hypothetical protein
MIFDFRFDLRYLNKLNISEIIIYIEIEIEQHNNYAFFYANKCNHKCSYKYEYVNQAQHEPLLLQLVYF